ncbi:MAG: hypothetical protein QM503_12230 [Bacteroidota bacterium]
MKETLTFNKNSELFSDNPDVSFVNIAIKYTKTTAEETIWLHGAFKIHNDHSNNIKSLHKALIITWISGEVNVTKNLLENSVVFSDEETIQNDYRIGYFNYDLSDWLASEQLNNGYITVSLYEFISNTRFL